MLRTESQPVTVYSTLHIYSGYAIFDTVGKLICSTSVIQLMQCVIFCTTCFKIKLVATWLITMLAWQSFEKINCDGLGRVCEYCLYCIANQASMDVVWRFSFSTNPQSWTTDRQREVTSSILDWMLQISCDLRTGKLGLLSEQLRINTLWKFLDEGATKWNYAWQRYDCK